MEIIDIMRNSMKYDGKLNVLGSSIRKYREDANMSQAELSAKLTLLGVDIPKNSVQRLENGQRVIKDYELGALSKILDVSADALLRDFVKKLN